MRTAGGDGIEYGWRVGRSHGAERDAALRCRDLDHRLEPIEPTRSRPDDLDGDTGLDGGPFERRGHFIGADGDRTGIAGNEDAHRHRCASATSASRRASSSRPTTRPSSIADGAVAHSPRQ